MYKRPVRILFIHDEDAEKPDYAARHAAQAGEDWLEARAATATTLQNDAVLQAWPDLAVYLDGSSAEQAFRPHTQTKVWHCPPDLDWHDFAHAKIAGMIGGLRLLAKMDHSSAPGIGLPRRRK